MAHTCRPANAVGSHLAIWYLLSTRVPVRPFTMLARNCTDAGTYIYRRHLLGTGREDEARRVIAQLNSVPEDDAIVLETIEELEFAIRAENEGGKATWLECFSSRNMLWKRTLNGMMLQFIQQLNGQNFYCKPFHFFKTIFA